MSYSVSGIIDGPDAYSPPPSDDRSGSGKGESRLLIQVEIGMRRCEGWSRLRTDRPAPAVFSRSGRRMTSAALGSNKG